MRAKQPRSKSVASGARAAFLGAFTAGLKPRLSRPSLPSCPSLSASHATDASYSLWFVVVLCVLVVPVLGLAEIKQGAVFDQDVQAFAISQDNHVVYAVERMKRIKKLIVEHDDFWVGDVDGKSGRLLTATSLRRCPSLLMKSLAIRAIPSTRPCRISIAIKWTR